MAFISVSAAIFIAVITAIIFYLRRHFTYWSRQGVPGISFVEFRGFLAHQHVYSENIYKKYGRIFGSYSFHNKHLYVNEPDLIRDIMVKDFHVFPDHQKFHFGSTLLELSLFFLPGDERWKRIRSIISPAFTSGKLRSMLESMNDIADQFVGNIDKIAKNEKTLDFRKYVGAFAMDVIASCAYGVRIDSLHNPDHPVVLNAKKILGFDAKISTILSVIAPPIARFFNMEPFNKDGINYFDSMTNKIVSERKKAQKTGKIHKDFIQLMIDTEKNEEIETMSDDESGFIQEENNIDKHDNSLAKIDKTLTSDELTAQGILFFIAGYDTTSATLTHCFYHLANNQNCQQKLYEELQTISDFKYETLNKLKYLNAVLSETLRLSPPLLRIARDCISDYKLGNTGITIPAGSTVTFLPYSIHRDPNNFEDADQFKPERFIDAKHHPYAYIPFGGGQRNCIGMRFALNEMRACVAKLISKFKFEVPLQFEEIKYFTGSIVHSPKKLQLSVKTRI